MAARHIESKTRDARQCFSCKTTSVHFVCKTCKPPRILCIQCRRKHNPKHLCREVNANTHEQLLLSLKQVGVDLFSTPSMFVGSGEVLESTDGNVAIENDELQRVDVATKVYKTCNFGGAYHEKSSIESRTPSDGTSLNNTSDASSKITPKALKTNDKVLSSIAHNKSRTVAERTHDTGVHWPLSTSNAHGTSKGINATDDSADKHEHYGSGDCPTLDRTQISQAKVQSNPSALKTKHTPPIKPPIRLTKHNGNAPSKIASVQMPSNMKNIGSFKWCSDNINSYFIFCDAKSNRILSATFDGKDVYIHQHGNLRFKCVGEVIGCCVIQNSDIILKAHIHNKYIVLLSRFNGMCYQTITIHKSKGFPYMMFDYTGDQFAVMEYCSATNTSDNMKLAFIDLSTLKLSRSVNFSTPISDLHSDDTAIYHGKYIWALSQATEHVIIFNENGKVIKSETFTKDWISIARYPTPHSVLVGASTGELSKLTLKEIGDAIAIVVETLWKFEYPVKGLDLVETNNECFVATLDNSSTLFVYKL